MIIRKYFFDAVRTPLFSGALTQSQVWGMETILLEWDMQQLTDLRWLAYILATTYHETAKKVNGVFTRTMQPVEESGHGAGNDYGKKLKQGGGPGKRIAYEIPDKIFYGRGHTQNTWYENYQRLTQGAKIQGRDWDFLNNPELLLQMEPSIWATFFAMRTGLYTGKKLSNYFNEKVEDWVNARKIVNGLDCAEKIAEYAKIFYEAVKGPQVEMAEKIQ